MRFRDFKTYYRDYVATYLRAEFPTLLSYTRVIQLMPRIVLALCAYLQHCYGQCSGISFIDATPLAVCHNRPISQHRVFEGIARRCRTSTGWFFGFKLHLVFNDCGEILSFCVTAGNVDDRQPVPKLVHDLFGKLFGDKGYLSKKLAHQLLEDHAIQLITIVRANMKNQLMDELDKFFLRKRAIMKTTQEHFADRTYPASQRHWFRRQLTGRLDCLLSSTQKTFLEPPVLSGFGSGLNKTHVSFRYT